MSQPVDPHQPVPPRPGTPAPVPGGSAAEGSGAQPRWAIPTAVPEAGAVPPQREGYAVPAPPTYPAYGYYGYPASPAPGGGQPPGVAVAPSSTSAVVLLVVSGAAIVASGIIGIPSAVLAILALRSGSRDPAASRRTTRIGWIVFAVSAAIGLVLIALLLWWLRRR